MKNPAEVAAIKIAKKFGYKHAHVQMVVVLDLVRIITAAFNRTMRSDEAIAAEIHNRLGDKFPQIWTKISGPGTQRLLIEAIQAAPRKPKSKLRKVGHGVWTVKQLIKSLQGASDLNAEIKMIDDNGDEVAPFGFTVDESPASGEAPAEVNIVVWNQ